MQQQGKKKSNVGLICAIVVVVVALVAAACVYFFVIAPQPSTSGGASVSASKATSASTSSNNAADIEYGTQLLAIYDAMSGLDSRIGTCANEFNNNYAKPDRSLRQGYANSAQQLESDIQAQITKLDKLKAENNSAYATDTQHVSELLNDLYNRIHVINRAWTNSLSYSNPQYYKDSIIAPITADNVDGNNKYYTHFKENYEKWKFSVS